MIDIQLIRDEPEIVRAGMRKRGIDPAPVDRLVMLDAQWRSKLHEVELLKAERNKVSKEIGKMKEEGARQQKIEDMRLVGDQIKALDDEVRELEAELNFTLSTIPNIPLEQVPEGHSEEDNIVMREWGEKPAFDFEPKPHWDLGPALGIIDFEAGVKITGSRFYVLTGDGARLQRAIIAFMLDLHREQGYLEQYTPFIVREETVYGAGQLPKFKDNLYKDHEEDLYLLPTSEVSLTGMHMDEILDGADLPIYYTAYSPCFRREKMSAGRDVRGIKRGHQFDKVEMYKFVHPDTSMGELDKMVRDAEVTCEKLGLPYRILLKCAGDTSEGAMISYDVEIWGAGVNEWLEVSSISNVGDYQSRRAKIRFRDEDGEIQLLHTLNGSGLGMPRVLLSILENNQQADGTVVIPEALRPYLGGQERITRRT
jgi:seryl-tRNA synthetase